MYKVNGIQDNGLKKYILKSQKNNIHKNKSAAKFQTSMAPPKKAYSVYMCE